MDNNDAEFDAIIMFEQIRKVSEATYLKNPLDADVSSVLRFNIVFCILLFDLCFVIQWMNFSLQNLTRWAGALLELAQFHNEDPKLTVQGFRFFYILNIN